ncbi:unnamed protein product [Ranitomeya imitator]|uniref:Uncharacterized protein n=1 Tax=Ranitomeya imitator TaxID=111125 RepID=A0ABN9MKB8_9NEOB|nr:unnamed protein product [Ranitomeya imitator]
MRHAPLYLTWGTHGHALCCVVRCMRLFCRKRRAQKTQQVAFFLRPNFGKKGRMRRKTQRFCVRFGVFLFALPAPAEATQRDAEASGSQAPVSDTKPTVDPSSAKDVPPFPEPRVQYPRLSSLTACEQDAYVKMMIKFLNNKYTNMAFQHMKEYNLYQFLKSKASNEVPEFQKFLQNAARSCAEDYDVLSPDADLYIQEMVKACQTNVKNYPSLYIVHEITSILGGKFIPDLTFKLEKCLLKMVKKKKELFIFTLFIGIPNILL